jgi:hypothetical protein
VLQLQLVCTAETTSYVYKMNLHDELIDDYRQWESVKQAGKGVE